MMTSAKLSTGRTAALLTVLVLGVCTSTAFAQFGPVMSAAGPINRSMGGASTAAPLSAAGALMWNPATLSGLQRNELEVGAELIFPHASVSSFYPANTFGPGAPPIDLSGQSASEDSVFAMPTIALAFRPENSDFTFGFGAFAVAGFGLDYAGSITNPLLTPPPPVGLGFGPVFSQYQVLQLAPALVYDVTDELSISVSPLLDIGSAQLDPASIAAPDDANGDGFATYPSGTHSQQSWGAGFSLGAYYQTEIWGFGACYKSPQWFQDYRFNSANELGVPQSFGFDLDIPSIVSIGTSYQGIERLLLAADLRYLDYGNAAGFGDSGFRPTGALRGIGLQSIFAASLGAQYQLTNSLSTRIGYSWSENPVSDNQSSANVASPLVIQNMLSAGATYQMTSALSLSLAYTHAFENSVSGPLVLPVGAIPGTRITNTASVDMLTIGATVKF